MRLLLLAALLAGCGTPCLDSVDASCTPLYAPTWDNVFTRTLEPTCGQPGGSCHAPEGAQGGFVVSDATSTLEALLAGDEPQVLAGDAACSLLVYVAATEDVDAQMPPGDPLSATEACAIQQWVDAGAQP